MTYNFYSDAGHGWLKVTKHQLMKLGIADQISSYSYQRGSYAYLEEDCDMWVFATAFKAQVGHDPQIVDIPSSINKSRIRDYEMYQHEL